MSDDITLILSFEPNNPANTTIKDQDGNTMYTISTTFDSKDIPTSTVTDGIGKRIADWWWKEPASVKLAFRDEVRIAQSSWLHETSIPFQHDVTFVSHQSGSKYKWKNNDAGLKLQLFKEGDKTHPIARWICAEVGVDGQALRVAKLLLTKDGEEIVDEVVVSFAILELAKRERENAQGMRADAIALGGYAMSEAVFPGSV